MTKSPDDEYSDGLEEQIKQLTAERDRLRAALKNLDDFSPAISVYEIQQFARDALATVRSE